GNGACGVCPCADVNATIKTPTTSTLPSTSSRLICTSRQGTLLRTVEVVNARPEVAAHLLQRRSDGEVRSDGGSTGAIRANSDERRRHAVSRAGVRLTFTERTLGRLDRVRAAVRRNAGPNTA